MKNIIPFVLLVSGCAGPVVTAGLNDGAAPAHTGVIEIQTDQSDEDLYRTLGRVLISQGFPLGTTDMDIGIVSSGSKDVGGSTFVQLNLLIAANGVVSVRGVFGNSIIGEAIATGGGDSSSAIEKAGMNGSPARNAWVAMHQMADAIADATAGTLVYR
jgi:hypothetical protein